MLANTREANRDGLLTETAALQLRGYRFVTVTCLDQGEAHEIYYHFDKEYQLENLRIVLPRGLSLPSISAVYPAAMLVENELKDLFGLTVDGLAIDYGGRLLLTEDAPSAPLNRAAPSEPASPEPPG
jgi:Ni,Fe-hydrogenase III component G